MKFRNTLYAITIIAAIGVFTSCEETLTNANISPNSLNAEKIDPGFILTEVLAKSGHTMVLAGFAGNTSQSILDATMQYVQQDQGEGVNVKNTFGWKGRGWGYRSFYLPLSNSNYLGKRAPDSVDSIFLRGVSLAFQAYWFGYNTSGWGDVPFSEAMRGDEGILRPRYDHQKDVFKGVLEYLEEANDAFSKAAVPTEFMRSADIMYHGDMTKWRSFVNSLQLRFLMRLSEKTAEMNEIGVDVLARFNSIVSNPERYPIILDNNSNAIIPLPGTSAEDSWPLGPFNQKTEDPYRRQKPGAPFVDFLKDHQDPRLPVWISPVDVQTVIEDKGADKKYDINDQGRVVKYLKSLSQSVDTSLFVGIPIALTNPDIYNGNNGDDRTTVTNMDPSIYGGGASNPFVSYFSSMFRENSSPYLPGTFITASEVYFLLAEAAVRGWISGSVEEFYQKGIQASLRQYDIFDQEATVYNPVTHEMEVYHENEFLQHMNTRLNEATDKLLPVIEQKWLALFTTVEAWFDWRRTGYPDLGKNLVNGPQGEKIPVRFYFGDSEKNFNEENVNKAISNLQPAVDDQWSKMWLLQGTGKPW